MKKSKFIRSTIILLIGGFITKLLGMFIKIILTRQIGTTGIGIYMLIMPTFMLLVSISQLGFPVAISKLVAEEKYNNKKLILGIIPISLLINFLLFFLILVFAKTISFNLLNEERTYLGVLSIGFVLPFVSISSILRGYFLGKERMFIHIISNIMEDLIKLFLIIIFVPYFLNIGIEETIAFIIFSSIFSELSSIIIFLICAPNKISIKKNDFIPSKQNTNNILNIGLPTTGSRLIGNVGYFLEPIILTFVLLNCGYSNNFIITEYGVINGYVMPLLLLPSFFSLAISQALIPVISKAYSNHNIKYVKFKIKQALLISLSIGIPTTIIFIFIPEIPLKLIYNTDLGLNYIKFLAPVFLLHYVQSPIVSCLQAMNKAVQAMKGTLYGMIIRTIILFSFSYLKIGIWGLILAISSNILFVTIYQIISLKEALKK